MVDLPETIEARTIAGVPGETRIELLVLPGEGLATRSIPLLEGVEITVGRSRTATISIDNEQVSRLHARLILRQGLVMVEDLGSRNGIRINGIRLLETTVAAPGAAIAIGPMLAVVTRGSGHAAHTRSGHDLSNERHHAAKPVIVDAAMQRVYAQVDKVADSPMTVLILGETGVGKELVAEAIHRRSSRSSGPLVRLNCASLPESLVESELFGHEKGAFTGADRRKIGYLEAASGGTLFLDEIGEMVPTLQVKLLRTLECRVVTRIGGTAEIPIDVRLVAATHRDLEAAILAGTFRQDLFFRLGGFTLQIPPLRDRPSDIMPLAEQFAANFAVGLGQSTPVFSESCRRKLLAHRWPGNVRELRNAIERAVVMGTGHQIDPEHLPTWPTRSATSEPLDATRPGGDVREQVAGVERAAIIAALEASGGNQTAAAQRLGLSRRGLIYKLEKYGLKSPPSSGR